VNIGDKPYPCCGFTHAAVDAVYAMQAKHKIDPAKIKEVIVTAGQATYDLARPPEVKSKPRTIIDAQFSVPYVTALALVQGKVAVDDFTIEAIKRPNILKVAQKVTAALDKSMDRHGVGPSRVAVTMADGTTYSEYIEYCIGSVERPMTLEDIARKFRECAPCAVKPLSKAKIEKVINMVGRLEELEDAADVIRAVA
jgi:2-methylcitrate dehydratase PrpD